MGKTTVIVDRILRVICEGSQGAIRGSEVKSDPFGKSGLNRVHEGELEQLEKEYKRIGDFLKQKCAGYTGYLLMGNKELAAKIGLKASRRMVFYNGKIECRLLKYELYKGTRQK